jgi:hypothetical protein
LRFTTCNPNSFPHSYTGGTAAGTVMVIDINPGAGHSNPGDFTVFNGALYFSADDGTNGHELWK